jgi:hypothetical protein
MGFVSFKRILFVVKVEGLSCWPFLKPGRKYFATSLGRPKKGDFVVFRDPKKRDRFLVKKVAVEEKEGYRVVSILPLAQIDENFGSVPRSSIEGKIIKWI